MRQWKHSKAYNLQSPADILVAYSQREQADDLTPLSRRTAWFDVLHQLRFVRHYDRGRRFLEGAGRGFNVSPARAVFTIGFPHPKPDESRVPQTARLQLTV